MAEQVEGAQSPRVVRESPVFCDRAFCAALPLEIAVAADGLLTKAFEPAWFQPDYRAGDVVHTCCPTRVGMPVTSRMTARLEEAVPADPRRLLHGPEVPFPPPVTTERDEDRLRSTSAQPVWQRLNLRRAFGVIGPYASSRLMGAESTLRLGMCRQMPARVAFVLGMDGVLAFTADEHSRELRVSCAPYRVTDRSLAVREAGSW
jgi:hypothetical protein